MPRDPRLTGETAYAQGDVTVPPEPTEPPGPFGSPRLSVPPADPASGNPVAGPGATPEAGSGPGPAPAYGASAERPPWPWGAPPARTVGPGFGQGPPPRPAGQDSPPTPTAGPGGSDVGQDPPARSGVPASPQGAPDGAPDGPGRPEYPPAPPASAGPSLPPGPSAPAGPSRPQVPPVRSAGAGQPQALPARPVGPGVPQETAAGTGGAPPAASPAPAAVPPGRPPVRGPERPTVSHLGDRAPTYAAEPGALPAADPAALDDLTPDTVLEGARYGTYTLRAASVRGDSARYRGEARRDCLLTARFGSGDDALVLVVLAGGDRAAPGAGEAAAELCHTVAAAVGRSRERLADDIRAGRREALRSGLQRLTDRGYGRLRARAAELGLPEDARTAGLRGLLLPLDPRCPHRVCFGAGPGGVFRLRAGEWQDLEPGTGSPPAPGAAPTAPAPEPGTGTGTGGFRFRASVARPGDTLLLCSGGLAEPMREEALLPAELAARWSQGEPPGLAAFLADTQLRLKGYAADRTAAAVWEA
ncbi:protein phosphatase 2C domain-containing protein [Streptomyces sp. DK15]|uniref:protein phosphatase 2C domain-containing protein n=1 Tax=Streptomyces sp. DK15 TaxID=2957499 RepID=UPI0029C0FDD6|nr:protein phosphatase 2C domain-containing protein [Streptomyces sp. DK15]